MSYLNINKAFQSLGNINQGKLKKAPKNMEEALQITSHKVSNLAELEKNGRYIPPKESFFSKHKQGQISREEIAEICRKVKNDI